MTSSAVAPQRLGTRPRPAGGRPARRLAPVQAQRKGDVDLDRTASLRELMAKPGILLVGFSGRRWSALQRAPAC